MRTFFQNIIANFPYWKPEFFSKEYIAYFSYREQYSPTLGPNDMRYFILIGRYIAELSLSGVRNFAHSTQDRGWEGVKFFAELVITG